MKKSLNGKWYFKEVGTQYWYDAIVPGCNFLDLMSNGKIPDPFIGLNEAKVTWVGEKDWEYKKTFIIKEKALNYNDILLNCKMLDTICDVLINDKLLFKGNNCFKSYSYSIKWNCAHQKTSMSFRMGLGSRFALQRYYKGY